MVNASCAWSWDNSKLDDYTRGKYYRINYIKGGYPFYNILKLEYNETMEITKLGVNYIFTLIKIVTHVITSYIIILNYITDV